MPLAEAVGAICVQRFDDSRNSAIHTTYRISLRSSSMREPRYPLLRVVFGLPAPLSRAAVHSFRQFVVWVVSWTGGGQPQGHAQAEARVLIVGCDPLVPHPADPWVSRVFSSASPVPGGGPTKGAYEWFAVWLLIRFNDPSAGSPTER